MIKKLMACLLCIAMLSAFLIPAFAEENIVGDEAADTIFGLEITPEKWKDSFDGKEIITYGNFSYMLAKIIDPEISDADTAIEYLEKRNMTPSENKLNTNSQVNLETAAEMLIKLLGYAMMAKESGSYVKTARDIKLLKGVNVADGQTINNEAALQLIFNAMSIDLMEIDYNGDGSYSTSVKKGEKLLARYRNIYRAQGQMTENRYSTLYSGEIFDENYIMVGKEKYISKDSSFDEFLGYDVIIYYELERGEKTAKLVLKSDKNDIIDVCGKYVDYVSERIDEIKYYENETDSTLKRLKLDPAIAVIYNGISDSTYTVNDFKGEFTRLKFIDTNDDNKYDVVYINAYEEMFVNGISTIDNEIYNSFEYDGALKTLELEGYKNYVSIYKDGEQIELSDIKSGDILCIAQSRSNDVRVINILVSSQIISGKLSYFNKSENELMIDGVKYLISETYLKAFAAENRKTPELLSGKCYEFYINAFGYVTAAKSLAVNEYGYLYRAYCENDDDGYYIKYLAPDNEWYLRKVKDKVNFNGTKVDAEVCYNSLIDADEKAIKQVIRLATDSKGEVKELLTADITNTYNENKFTTDGIIRNKRKYFTGQRCFQGDYFLEQNGVVFQVPSVSAPDEVKSNIDCYMALSSLAETEYNYQVYDANDYKIAKLAVVYTDSAGSRGNYLLVKDVEDTINSDDEPTKKIYGDYNGYINMSFWGSNGALDDVEQGDFIRLFFDAKGFVTRYETVYKIATGKKYTGDHHGNWGASGQWDTGIIKSVDTEIGYMLVALSETGIYSAKIPSNVQIFDVKEKEFSVGGAGDIRPGDYVIMNVAYYSVATMVVYRF